MGSYTTQLRNVCEIYGKTEVENWFKDYNLNDYLTTAQIESIEKHGVWNKDKLASKIVEHYYMREIGFETPALFKLQAKIRMQELMEDYLPVIYSNSLEYDPLVNVDFTETFERKIEGNSNSNSNSNSSGLNVASDTPQGQINKQAILKGAYASQTNANETEGNIQDETSTKNNENYTRHQKGNSGTLTTAQALVKQYRETIRAVDREIIENLNILFMGIY